MIGPIPRILFRGLMLSGTAALAVCAAGCQSGAAGRTGGQDGKNRYLEIEKEPKRNDIVRLVQFWNPSPWLYDSTSRVIGFKVPTYFISSETEKGAFVTGKVFAWMHLVEPNEQGELFRRTVHMWQIEPDEVFQFASRKKAIGGFFHGFMLTWPTSLDVAGRTIEIEFGYQRDDAHLVMGSARTFLVPGRPSGAASPRLPPAREPE
jgi:hypothetical protein